MSRESCLEDFKNSSELLLPAYLVFVGASLLQLGLKLGIYDGDAPDCIVVRRYEIVAFL
jgi:hypothetical protein